MVTNMDKHLYFLKITSFLEAQDKKLKCVKYTLTPYVKYYYKSTKVLNDFKTTVVGISGYEVLTTFNRWRWDLYNVIYRLPHLCM